MYLFLRFKVHVSSPRQLTSKINITTKNKSQNNTLPAEEINIMNKSCSTKITASKQTQSQKQTTKVKSKGQI